MYLREATLAKIFSRRRLRVYGVYIAHHAERVPEGAMHFNYFTLVLENSAGLASEAKIWPSGN